MRAQWLELSVALALAAAAVASGVWIVAAKHESRQLFAELQELEREQDRLQIDWGRLQIEQSWRAANAQIETLARERLELEEPRDTQVKIIVEPAP
jgi:cell division protein FtsL